MSFWSSKLVRARKPYRCDEGGGEINRGHLYWSHAGIWDGEFETYRACATCEGLWSAMQRLFPGDWEDGRHLGELRAELRELVGERAAKAVCAKWPCGSNPQPEIGRPEQIGVAP